MKPPRKGQTLPSSCRVRHYPEISAAALKTRQDKKLALWYAIHDLNVTGHDFLDVTDTIANLVSIFCYSQKTVYQGGGDVSDLPAIAAGDPSAR